jgi:hypothetical protein
MADATPQFHDDPPTSRDDPARAELLPLLPLTQGVVFADGGHDAIGPTRPRRRRWAGRAPGPVCAGRRPLEGGTIAQIRAQASWQRDARLDHAASWRVGTGSGGAEARCVRVGPVDDASRPACPRLAKGVPRSSGRSSTAAPASATCSCRHAQANKRHAAYAPDLRWSSIGLLEDDVGNGSARAAWERETSADLELKDRIRTEVATARRQQRKAAAARMN